MHHHEESNFVSILFIFVQKSNFQRREVNIPSRSRTSSIGGDSNEGFLNPVHIYCASHEYNLKYVQNDFVGGFGQNSQSSVRSRTSVSNFEQRANRMSQVKTTSLIYIFHLYSCSCRFRRIRMSLCLFLEVEDTMVMLPLEVCAVKSLVRYIILLLMRCLLLKIIAVSERCYEQSR